MASPTNMKSASLATALESRHSGRTLPTTAFNLVKNVTVFKTVAAAEIKFRHLVFTLPKSYLRSSAIGWDQFQEDTRGLGMLKCFAFFVQMVYLLQSSSGGDTHSMTCSHSVMQHTQHTINYTNYTYLYQRMTGNYRKLLIADFQLRFEQSLLPTTHHLCPTKAYCMLTCTNSSILLEVS